MLGWTQMVESRRNQFCWCMCLFDLLAFSRSVRVHVSHASLLVGAWVSFFLLLLSNLDSVIGALLTSSSLLSAGVFAHSFSHSLTHPAPYLTP